jgi:predicted SAM-dependent methyltransferase
MVQKIRKLIKFIKQKIKSSENKIDFLKASEKMKIHLGCGEVNLEGFINVDARDNKHVHIVKNDLYLNEFSDSTLEMIYMCHVLEHISHKEVTGYLTHYCNKLKDGGVLRLSVPDFDRIIEIYNASGSDCDSIKSPLMGGQGYEYNYHYNVFNKKSLMTLLEKAGFKDVRLWYPDKEEGFSGVDWASKKIPYNFGEFVISLNVEAVK